MSNWREVTLGEGVDVLHGFAFKGENFRAEGELIVLTPGNFFDDGGFKPKSGKEKYYDGPFPQKFLLRAGDVVVAMTEQVRGLLGSSATVPEDDVYLHNQRIGLVRVADPDLVDERFVYHLMNSAAVREQLQATATGSKVRHTAPERIRAVRACVPHVTVQRQIASILDAIDDLIGNNRRRVEVLEEMARAIYQEWFVRFRYPGHEDGPLVDSPLGPIPDSWSTSPFSDLATFVNGFAFNPGHWGTSGRPIIKIKELKQGVTAGTPRCNELMIAPKYWIEPGDLLFSWSADLGVYRWAGEGGLLNQHLFVVRPRADLSVTFLQHALAAAVPQFWDRAQGTTMRHIKRSALTEVSTPVPPPLLVSRFTETAEPLAREGLVLGQSVRELTRLRDLLLPRLVTGRIDVSHLDLDGLTEAATA